MNRTRAKCSPFPLPPFPAPPPSHITTFTILIVLKNHSGGLSPSGSSTGGCRDTSKGQTYARIGVANGTTAIMYTWYWPKDQTVDGVSTGAHRHDWENMIVWVDNTTDPANPTILGGGASGHGEYKITKGTLPGGNTAQVEYFSSFPTNHELQFTNTGGNTLAISDWDAMPQVARDALQTTDFGSANVPFKDGNFEDNLAKAALPA